MTKLMTLAAANEGEGDWLAIDWGTSNRRAWRLSANGDVRDSMADDAGVLSVAPGGFPSALAAVRSRLGDLPALAAGMVGSTRGWIEAPYVALPAGLSDLAERLVMVEGSRLSIIPGLCSSDDVMRGEEVQFLGAAAAGLVPTDGLLCQPGTHNKWSWLDGGRLTRFRTTMPGELFSLLKTGSILSDLLQAPVSTGAAFRDGVLAAARDSDLLAQLFSVRARVLTGLLPRNDAASYASGLLIGADVAPRLGEAPIFILAGENFQRLYGTAIDTLGGTSVAIDSTAAFLAGVIRIRELAV